MAKELQAHELPEIVTQVKNPVKYTGGADVNGFIDSYQAAIDLNIHWHTMQNYIRSGRIPASKIGKKWRISVQDFENFKNGLLPTNIKGTANFVPSGNSRTKKRCLTVDEVSTIREILTERFSASFDVEEKEHLTTIIKKLDSIKTC